MKENLVAEYYQKLLSSETPHLILAAFYKELFQKSVMDKEWGILRKAINLYGREVVFEAMVRTASSTTVDMSKSIWPYINSIAITLSDSMNKLAKSSNEAAKQIEATSALLEELKQVKSDEVNLTTQEEFHGPTVKQFDSTK